MDIFIAGCARSGTTQFRWLLKGLADTYVAKMEQPAATLDKLKVRQANRVIKRTEECWRTLPELPEKVFLFYSVRHPYDVLTSIHPKTADKRQYHVTPERWLVEYRSLKKLRHTQPTRPIFIVKYESMVLAPEVLEREIVQSLGIPVVIPFTNPARGRKLFTSSVMKWQRDAERISYLKQLPRYLEKELAEFCEEFGYTVELP
jgi:hypothetical protein